MGVGEMDEVRTSFVVEMTGRQIVCSSWRGQEKTIVQLLMGELLTYTF